MATYTFTIALGTVSVLSATPTGFYTIRVKFSAAMRRIDPLAPDDASNPANYTITGGFRKLSVRQVTVVTSTTFDILVDEMQDGAAYTVTVAGAVSDEALTDTITSSNLNDSANFIGLGEHPVVVDVTNEDPGILVVRFSEDMNVDGILSSPGSYTVSPVGQSPAIIITRVKTDKKTPSIATLTFEGGGSPYCMTVKGPIDPAGNDVIPNLFCFDLTNPSIDELNSGKRTFFETDLGALKLTIASLSRRRIEDLAIQRAQSIGNEEQFKIISSSLRNSGINRDDQKLKLFKG